MSGRIALSTRFGAITTLGLTSIVLLPTRAVMKPDSVPQERQLKGRSSCSFSWLRH